MYSYPFLKIPIKISKAGKSLTKAGHTLPCQLQSHLLSLLSEDLVPCS